MKEEVKAASKSGVATLRVRSIIKTSNTNKTPAIGALKTPAIAPAAPQESKVIACFLLIRKKRLMFEPIALHVKTIGASNPTEPPKATVIEEVITEDQQ